MAKAIGSAETNEVQVELLGRRAYENITKDRRKKIFFEQKWTRKFPGIKQHRMVRRGTRGRIRELINDEE